MAAYSEFNVPSWARSTPPAMDALCLDGLLSKYLGEKIEQKIKEMLPEIMAEHCKFFHKKRSLLTEKIKS